MDKKKFYDNIRSTFTLTATNVKGFDYVLDQAGKLNIPLHYLAYILATTFHETAHTMQPVTEYGSQAYLKSKKYWPYIGRGYVQLTWEVNYKKATDYFNKILGIKVDFVKNPDLVKKPEYAIIILFVGMQEGWFTGKSLKDYIDDIDEDDKEDLREFTNARRIINGTDKQVMIGQYAIVFEKALKAAGYTLEATEKPVEKLPDDPGTQMPSKSKTSVWSFIFDLIASIFGAKK